MTDFIPVLSYGAHSGPKEGACIMEMVSFMSGDEWTDVPKCSNRFISRVAQTVNDALSDGDLGMIFRDFHRLFNTTDVTEEEMEYEFCKYISERVDSDAVLLYSGETQFNFRDVLASYTTDGDAYSALEDYGYALEYTEDSEAIAGLLTDILDIYDRLSGRTEVVTQDLLKLQSLPCQV